MNEFYKTYNYLKITKEQIYSNLNEIKNIRDEFEQMYLIDSAEFFTDKLVTLLKDDTEEIYKHAKYLHEKEQYHRAALMLISKNLHLNDLSCRHLAAKCYFDCGEYPKSLELLNLPVETVTYDEKGGSLDQWKSSIELLKGYIYEAMGDIGMANKCFLDAIDLDNFCFEAFQALTKFDMISKDQETQLLHILSSSNENEIDASIFIKKLYKIQFTKKLDSGENSTNKEEGDDQSSFLCKKLLPSSHDLLLVVAENHYDDCNFDKSYEILSEIYADDILNLKCIFLMIGCLLELKNEIVLQNLSHKLVESNPESPISWYAVGCYYYLSSTMDNARKYFSKANSIDSNFKPAILMLGHSFEMEALHDQAIAVYLDLSKKMPHSYLPLLYVGVEYGHLNNFTLASQYLNTALELSPDNLFVLHELGIVSFHKKDYDNAQKYFNMVYAILSKKKFLMKFSEKWEPLVNNLGHVYRKLGKYDEAIFYYKIALRMLPDTSTLDSLGLVYSLKGELQMASDYFQKVLSLKRDDAFALTMYNLVCQRLINLEKDS